MLPHPAPLVTVGDAPTRTPATLFTYRATIQTTVLSSSQELASPLSPGLRKALVEPPDWCEWPPATLPPSVADVSALPAEKLLLLRLVALFTFASGIPGKTATDVWTGVEAQWPRFYAARQDVLAGRAVVTYEYAAVTAAVDAAGGLSWGFDRNVNNGDPVPITETKPGATRPEYDRLIQNVVRADLLERLGAE